MHDALQRFYLAKREFLNPPASDESVSAAIATIGGGIPHISQIHKIFDGEKAWGAFLPEYHVMSLHGISEMVSANSYASEMLEEDDIDPAKGFFPFISTDRKSQIGLLSNPASALNGCVIEYDPECGTHLLWSKSFDQFVDAFFSLSATMPVSNSNGGAEEFTFTAQQRAFLSKWPDVVHPVFETEPVRPGNG